MGVWVVYFDLTVPKSQNNPKAKRKSLGCIPCKHSTTVSNGDKWQIKQTQKWAKKPAVAQKAKNKQCFKAIHAKIKNTRQDLIYKFTTQPVKDNAPVRKAKQVCQ